MDKLRTVMELISLSTEYLVKQGCESPRLDAELLLGYVLKMDRLQLYLNFDKPLTSQEVDEYRRLIGLRGRHTPVAYLTGVKEFYGRQFIVSPDVLIPRPDTEILVETAISLGAAYPQLKVLDIGTGSGAIAISIAAELEESLVTAADISLKALQITSTNARELGVANRVELIHSDLFTKLTGKQFNMICSNPPYIEREDIPGLQGEVQHEPVSALDGGADGLDFYRAIISQAAGFLVKPGYLIFEIGWDQAAAVQALGISAGFSWEATIQDYAGKDRVVVLKWQ